MQMSLFLQIFCTQMLLSKLKPPCDAETVYLFVDSFTFLYICLFLLCKSFEDAHMQTCWASPSHSVMRKPFILLLICLFVYFLLLCKSFAHRCAHANKLSKPRPPCDEETIDLFVNLFVCIFSFIVQIFCSQMQTCCWASPSRGVMRKPFIFLFICLLFVCFFLCVFLLLSCKSFAHRCTQMQTCWASPSRGVMRKPSPN